MTTKFELLQHLNTKSSYLNLQKDNLSKNQSHSNILNRFFFEAPKSKMKQFPKPPMSPTMNTSSKNTPINMYNKISINKKSLDIPRNSNLKFKHIKPSPSTSLNSNNNSQNTSKTITVNQSLNFKEAKSLTRSISPVSTSSPISTISVAKHPKLSSSKKSTPLRPPAYLHMTSKTPTSSLRASSAKRNISVSSSSSTHRRNNYKPLSKKRYGCANMKSNTSYNVYTNRSLRKSPSPISIVGALTTGIRKKAHTPFHTDSVSNRSLSKGNAVNTYGNCKSAACSKKKVFKKIKTVSPLSSADTKKKMVGRIAGIKSPKRNGDIKVKQVSNLTVKDIKNGFNISRNECANMKQSKLSNVKNTQHVYQHNQQQSSMCSNNSVVSIKKTFKMLVRSNIGVVSKMGINSICEVPKRDNQDNYFISYYDDMSIHFIGVCDGHGTYGHLVSTFIKETLPLCLHKELMNKSFISNNSSNSILHSSVIKRCIENAFLHTNSKLSNNACIDSNFSGSTCAAVLVVNDYLYAANVGDSRAIICKSFVVNGMTSWKCEAITRDHKASELDEAKRIERFGGRIEQYKDEKGVYVGPMRVWLKNDQVPGLAMTRSFGDQIASSVGVVSDPEIKEYFIREEDKVIIIASDGLWEYISNEEVCDIVKNVYADRNSEKICQLLHKLAYKRWKENDDCVDDITIIAVCFD